MARGVNKVILVGNLGADPDVRYSASGSAVTNISIATSESWTDKKTGERQERTEWHRVTLFSRLGEIAGEYCRKGSQVYIEGSLRTDKYQDKKTGEDRYSTSIVANNLQLLGARGEGQGQGSGMGGGMSSSMGATGANNRGGQQQPQQPREPVAEAAEFDDDIPF